MIVLQSKMPILVHLLQHRKSYTTLTWHTELKSQGGQDKTPQLSHIYHIKFINLAEFMQSEFTLKSHLISLELFYSVNKVRYILKS